MFVQAATRTPSVQRIAIVGSIVTNKASPNDIDLLVTIDLQHPLDQLATAARRLKGHAQSRNSGADVFLCSPTGDYFGRICQWRHCSPTARATCPAPGCGLHEFLCDDLYRITLPRSLILNPPVIVWPRVQHAMHLPPDVESFLATLSESSYLPEQ